VDVSKEKEDAIAKKKADADKKKIRSTSKPTMR
jgi:hypothetical protein